MVDRNAEAGYERAIARRGEWIILRRESGFAGAIATVDVKVKAILANYLPKPPLAGGNAPDADITLGARNVTVLARDLKSGKFPLPVIKGDKVILLGPAPTDPAQPSFALPDGAVVYELEILNVSSVDPYTRAIAGAIDIVAAGV